MRKSLNPNNKYTKLRRKLGMNQKDFWGRVGVTQSGGSRIEGGRSPGRSTKICLDLAFGSPAERAKAAKGLGIADLLQNV